MNFKFSDRINCIGLSGIRKINEKALAIEQSGEKVLHFEIGRPDFDSPEYIKNACIESLQNGDVFYTSNLGDRKLRETIAEYLNKRYATMYNFEEILVTVGLSEAIYSVFFSLLNPGDEILVPDPIWINYINVPITLGAIPVSYSLLESNDYQPNIQEMKSKITDKTKVLVLNSPNNPTGSILNKTTLSNIAQLAIENDLIIVSDEIYDRLIYDNEKHISIASLSGMKERTVTLNGYSKTYSMTGWRLGYIAAPKELINTVNKIHQHIVTCAPSFVQKAGIVALTNESGEVEIMQREYQRRRNYAVEIINSIPGLHCLPPKGSFYIFINIKDLNISAETIVAYLLEHKKIALVPGSIFGKNGTDYIRMSFANSYENIVEGCRLLQEGISELVDLNK